MRFKKKQLMSIESQRLETGARTSAPGGGEKDFLCARHRSQPFKCLLIIDCSM